MQPISSADGRLQLGISRGSPEQVIDGWRYFGYEPADGETDADMARRHAEVFLELLGGEGFCRTQSAPMFSNPPGLLRIEPYSAGLRERIWWGAASNATAAWAGTLGMHLQSSTLKFDESGQPLHVQQAEQIRIYREAWQAAGHQREPRVSVSRSIFPLVDERDWAYFGNRQQQGDHIGYIDPQTRAIFGRNYAAEPQELIEQLHEDTAIAAADTLLLTVPNQLGRRLQRPCHRIGPEFCRTRNGLAMEEERSWRALVDEGHRAAQPIPKERSLAPASSPDIAVLVREQHARVLDCREVARR